MAEGGKGVPLEVPSVALDRLFLKLYDKLPREARGDLAQLADEVKKLTETSTADAAESQPSSADQAVVRREEGTIEAKQTSADLPARGEVMHTVGCPVKYQKWDTFLTDGTSESDAFSFQRTGI